MSGAQVTRASPSGGSGGSLTPTALQSGTVTVAANQYVPLDLSAVNATLPLPNAPDDKTQVGYKVEAFTAGKTLTVTTAGADTFDTGATSATPTLVQASSKIFQYNATAKTWTALSGDTPISQLDTRYLPLSPAADRTDSSSGVVIESGQYRVAYEELNAFDPKTGLVPNSASTQDAAFLAFLNILVAAKGTGRIPKGGAPIKLGAQIAPNSGPFSLRGDTTVTDPRNGEMGSILQWTADTANGPETTGALALGPSAIVDGISFKAPARFSTNTYGVRPTAFAALQHQGSTKIKNCLFNGWGDAILAGGSGLGADHCDYDNLGISGCGFGIFTAAGTNAGGDVHARNIRMDSALLACLGQSAGGTALWQGGYVTGCGLYGPYAFMVWDEGSGSGQFTAMAAMLWHASNVESPGNGCIYSELWNNASHFDLVFDNYFGQGLFGNIVGTRNWTSTWTPGAISVSTNQLTVQVPTGGFVFRKGMTISAADGSIPANTTVTAVTGTWPNGVSGAGSTAQYTLTLSNAPTGTPVGNITVTMPRLAKITAGSFSDNEIAGSLATGSFPLIKVGSGGANNNRGADGTGALQTAQNNKIVSYGGAGTTPTIAGNLWGVAAGGGNRLVSMAVPASVTITQFDLVEQYDAFASGHEPGVRPAATSGSVLKGPIVGIAQQAVTGVVDSVDVLVSSGAGGTTVNNKSGSSIASGAFIKPDLSNPGGVTTAAGFNDGPVVGIALALIGATSTGTAMVFPAAGSPSSGAAGLSTTVIAASNASWPIPAGAQFLEVTAVGAGGQGGGGGSSATATANAGGGGGSAGVAATEIVAVGANTTLNVVIGAASATASPGGNAGGNAGTNGHAGSASSVSGTGISVIGAGGVGGVGGAANTTTAAGGGAYGNPNGTTAAGTVTPGSGGLGTIAGGPPNGRSAGGGGGGAAANTGGLGGTGGGAGTASAGGSGGTNGGSGTAAGTNGSAAAANTGAGGGGGGGGTSGTGAGGSGGFGGSGYVIISVVG